MKLRNIILAAMAIVALSSCKSQYEMLLTSNDADLKYEAAFDYFNEGKYSKAGSLFESLSVLTNGTERDDTVRFYWGLSNYKFEYRIEFPRTPHMEACREMLVDLNERLDKKAYEAARLYYKMENYKSARVAFRNVLKDDADNIYREDILYYIAMSSYNYAHMSIPEKQKERYLTFVDDYLNFIGEIPQSHYRKELDTVYRKAQKALGRDITIEDDEMSEKDFAKERRKLLREEKKSQKN